MAQTVRVYIKKQLRLDLLSIPQRQMYDLGVAGLGSIKQRVARAYGVNDAPAPPLKMTRRKRWSKSQNKWVEYGNPVAGWARIKVKHGLKPIRDLHGTGMMWPDKGGARKPKLKNVGHLMEQMMVRRVGGDNRVFIDEPSTRYGRKKARNKNNRAMLGFSPLDRATIVRNAQILLNELKTRMVKAFARGSA